MTAPWPSRELVQRVIVETAEQLGVLPDVVAFRRTKLITRARVEVWRRLVIDAGYSPIGVAKAWGTDPSAIYRALKAAGHDVRTRSTGNDDVKPPYRKHYEACIRWQYPDRADAILAGSDARSNADLAHWDALGRRSAA
jgi:hypothetical protein